jgi:DNA-binding winged helix-turn-helix (wHTH) protein
VFIRKLRQKLEAVSPPWRYIHTHFGVGYRFDPELREGDAPAPAAPAMADSALDDAFEQITAGLPE